MSDLKKRIENLENVTGQAEKPLAVHFEGAETVRLIGTGQVMPLDEFRSIYPQGTLMEVTYDKNSSLDDPDRRNGGGR
jgi:hypothetical protein